jgi:hypothetical protein
VAEPVEVVRRQPIALAFAARACSGVCLAAREDQ